MGIWSGSFKRLRCELLDKRERELLVWGMSNPPIRRPHFWLTLGAFGLLWGVLIRQFSPHWSVLPQYNYGWGVPFLCCYLLSERWLTRPHPDESRTAFWPVAAMIFAALIFFPARIVQEANTTWRLSSWVMAFGAVVISLGGIYMAGGRAWLRHFSFPVVFFLVAVPWPTGLNHFIIQNLTQLDVGATVEAATLIGIPAMQHGNVIEVSTGLVGIDEACSGIRSFEATLMISLFLGEMYRFRPVRRIFLVVIGALLAFIFNVARTFVLLNVAARKGIPAVAKWHDPAGVTILIGCFTSLWVAAFWMQRKDKPLKISRNVPAPRPLPIPFCGALAAWMVLMEAGTEFWYRAHESKTLAMSKWSVNWPQDKKQFRFDTIPSESREIMNFDEGQAARWVGTDGLGWQVFYFKWNPARSLSQRVKIQAAKGHRPDICLRATGMVLREDFGIRTVALGGLKFYFHRYRFEDRSRSLYVFYSASEDGALDDSPTNLREDTRARLAAALAGTRGLGQRMLEFVISGAADQAQAEKALESELSNLIAR